LNRIDAEIRLDDAAEKLAQPADAASDIDNSSAGAAST
jgi:hypothetical protein